MIVSIETTVENCNPKIPVATWQQPENCITGNGIRVCRIIGIDGEGIPVIANETFPRAEPQKP